MMSKLTRMYPVVNSATGSLAEKKQEEKSQ